MRTNSMRHSSNTTWQSDNKNYRGGSAYVIMPTFKGFFNDCLEPKKTEVEYKIPN